MLKTCRSAKESKGQRPAQTGENEPVGFMSCIGCKQPKETRRIKAWDGSGEVCFDCLAKKENERLAEGRIYI